MEMMGFVVRTLAVVAIVPQQTAVVVENLSKYLRTLSAGFYILVPFLVERQMQLTPLPHQA